MPSPNFKRRTLLHTGAAGLATISLSFLPQARADETRRFVPTPGDWRDFELTTSIDLRHGSGPSTIYVPLPSIDTAWQQTVSNGWRGNATSARLGADERYGARFLVAEFDGDASPQLEVTSRVRTRDRAQDWKAKQAVDATRADLRPWLMPTTLMPLDGIVLKTARQIVSGTHTDVDKVQRIYDWIVINAYREPKVRGCGVGDIKAMLETGNLGGKCGDLNGLFVGLCRAVGVPARDVYGIRLAKSAFNYRELGGNPDTLKGAQHCRAEVWLRQYGWVAMDPADVCKVMRQETQEWIKDPDHPVVAPVRRALFGGWEGNWMGYNFAHDVRLPGWPGGELGFLMYPQAHSGEEVRDALDPDAFSYTIRARAI
jgi:transglutaminase-like putative cysteine protease